jgi:glutamate dehydrogenase
VREAAVVTGPGGAADAGADPAAGAWQEAVAALLPGAAAGAEAAAFAARVPASYRERTPPAEAVADIAAVSALSESAGAASDEEWARSPFGGHHRLAVRPALDGDECTFRIRRYGEHGVELTRFLPVLESFGLVVVEAVPLLVGPGPDGQPAIHIDDVGVRLDAPHGPEALRFVPRIHGPRLVAALEAVAGGETEVDSLNRLVTAAGLDWRQVTVLRAYLHYRLQGATPFSAGELADPLVAFPDVARSLIGYFQARFDPGADRSSAAARQEAVVAAETIERVRCTAELDLVPDLQQDQVLRGYLQLIDATLRTNYFQVDPGDRRRPALTLKLDSAAVPDLPAPRPQVEAFVHGPIVEGIHLRAGLIARGGLRWSERPHDFRTEVLDLAFAQVKKNAIIVPTGAKGGFVCRRPGIAAEAAAYTPEDVQASYEAFIRALLDVTDNLIGGEVVHPPHVVAWDGPDPYLVVAADKGTATFSDLANALADEYRFWLGDAFASGGSRGYDHKAMGITAMGAWVAVRRHFHQLGIDVQTEPIRVAGVGDMSGDVFGNGMLQSRTIRLVAAFDHRDIFLDPDPDPSASFAERSRLAALPHSSWADYRPELISAGGGVWPRHAKAVPLADAARRALGVTGEALTPPELIAAILAAPIDLLWFGGIGTFVKAPDEPDSAVGDHANDAVRITSDQLRARVVAEGGNLGVTQQARIRYSRRGGRINTDFIDNAAGVATSDREVNCKILLALAIEAGRLDPGQRDGYLARSEAEVAGDVLRQVDHSVVALTRAVPDSAREFDAYVALLDTLEEAGRLDRAVEGLPSSEELRVRRDAGAGFIRPELAVLLAYAKADLVAAIEASPLVGDPALARAVVPYFPAPLREAFGDLIPKHRLYPQLVATDVGGELVDQLGLVWAHETAAELGRDAAEVAGAFWAAREVIGAGEQWADLEQRSSALSADAEAALHGAVRNAVIKLARAYLTGGEALPLGELIARDAPLAGEMVAAGAGEASKTDADVLVELGVDRDLAHRFVQAAGRANVAAAGEVARRTGRPVAEAAEAIELVGRAAAVDRLEEAVTRALAAVPAPSRLTAWQGRALLDDIRAWQQAAAAAALARPLSVAPAVAAWEAARERELARAAVLTGAAPQDSPDPLAVTALALRRLRLAL